jgi:hypothetical protein
MELYFIFIVRFVMFFTMFISGAVIVGTITGAMVVSVATALIIASAIVLYQNP